MKLKFSVNTILKTFLISVIFLIPISYIFVSDRFVEYAFYTIDGPHILFNSILRGDFDMALDTVRDRGRLGWLEFTFNSYEPSFFGIGLGTIAVDLEDTFGWKGGLHNDVVQYFFEGGYLGFFFYFLFFYSMFKISFKKRFSNDALTKFLSYSIGGFTFSLLIWSFISQVFTYADFSFMFIYLFMFLIYKRNSEIRNNVNEKTSIYRSVTSPL